MSRDTQVDLKQIPGLTPHEWAVLSFTAKSGIKAALAHGWHVEKVGRTLKFHLPVDPQNYRLASFAGLEFMGKKEDWRL